MVNSCRSCDSCNGSFENYCAGVVFTMNSTDTDGTTTQGGYSNVIVVDEHFVVRFPETLPLDKGAPLLCAGVTMYNPMKHFGLNEPGKHLGVVGMGGLGGSLARPSSSKEVEATERLGDYSFLAAVGTMDGIIDTVSAVHPLTPLILLLKSHGRMVMICAPDKPLELNVFPLIIGGKTLAVCCIGGMNWIYTQQMLDFAGEHNVTADIELIGIDYVNKAMERLVEAD